jgi:phosphoribosylglycinamide formyltransferase-1
VSYRVAVMVSGEGTNLQALLDTVHKREAIEIVGVASNRSDARALERARQARVQTGVFMPSEYTSREQRDELMGDWFESKGVDLIVLAGFMEILSPAFVRRFHGRLINVHPSLLPAFPGLRPIQQALDYGVQVTGVTVHFVDERVDSGPIILQEAFRLEGAYSRDIAAVENLVHEVEHRLLPEAVRLLARGRVKLDPAGGRHVLFEEAHDGDN